MHDRCWLWFNKSKKYRIKQEPSNFFPSSWLIWFLDYMALTELCSRPCCPHFHLKCSFFPSLFFCFFFNIELGLLIKLMCKKNVINVKLMAESNLILALNAQRAPCGGGWLGAFAQTVQWKKLLPSLPFKYDSRSSGSHRGFHCIDLHWWFLCFPLCLAQCDLWVSQAHKD